jgi:hypothetical protein
VGRRGSSVRLGRSLAAEGMSEGGGRVGSGFVD